MDEPELLDKVGIIQYLGGLKMTSTFVGRLRKWMPLMLGAVTLFTSCTTVTPWTGHGARLDRNPRAAPEWVDEPRGASQRPMTRPNASMNRSVARVNPAETVVRVVTSEVNQLDAFDSLLLLAGLDDIKDDSPRGAPLSPQGAARTLTILLNKPVTFGSLPPRMAACHLLREILETGDVSREELLHRVARFKTVAVLRPDGYLAWVFNGRTQQKVGSVQWREDAFRAGAFELGRFYIVSGWMFRRTDAQLRPILDGPGLAEVYDDADYIGRSLAGAEESFVELYHAMGQLLTRPLDSIAALQHLPAGVAALIASSPEYLERFQYMTRGEQVKAVSKMTTSLLLAVGTAGGATRMVTRTLDGLEVAMPVLTLSAEGQLVMGQAMVSAGQDTMMSIGAPGAAILLQKAGETSPRNSRSPHRTSPRIEDGDLKEGWQHIEARHITGHHPKGAGDLFAPGTTRQHLVKAAEEIVENGTRISRPGDRIQSFQMKIKINGRKDLVQVVVDSDDANRVITMFPINRGE